MEPWMAELVNWNAQQPTVIRGLKAAFLKATKAKVDRIEPQTKASLLPAAPAVKGTVLRDLVQAHRRNKAGAVAVENP